MSVLEQPLVFVDIETNGLNHLRGRVVEVAAIRVEGGEVVREFVSFVNPGAPLPQFITKLTGITDSDLANAPLFMAIAHELAEVLDGAIFVAHNVRFDYSFLKQEFKRIGKPFSPRQLCTMRLSRALYPAQRSHKLATLIATHGLQVSARHRAYDDAAALWQFLQKAHAQFPANVLEQAIAKQLKQPSLPKGLAPEALAALPTGTGVYIMYDQGGAPLYVGKSIHIRKRVGEHFMRDHDNVGEFNLAQRVASITAQETDSELEALLLESRLVKELLPYQNKLLQRTNKLVVAIQEHDEAGYLRVRTDLAAPDNLADTGQILAVYDRRSRLRSALEAAARDWNLCPRLLGLEKTGRACFWSQLGKCPGACTGSEPATTYNARVLLAFSRQQFQPWPYQGPILVQERSAVAETTTALLIDRWCVLGKLRREEGCEPVLERHTGNFDLDAYNILRHYLAEKQSQLHVRVLSRQELASLGI